MSNFFHFLIITEEAILNEEKTTEEAKLKIIEGSLYFSYYRFMT